MPPLAISAENLTYRYDQLLAVDHINFEVDAGEILGFLGPNGAGKSTTVKMLTGQLLPQEGRATLLGLDVARQPKQVQAQIGVCFELTNLYETMSGLENLKLFASLFGVRNGPAQARRVGGPLSGQGRALFQRHEATPDGGARPHQPA